LKFIDLIQLQIHRVTVHLNVLEGETIHFFININLIMMILKYM